MCINAQKNPHQFSSTEVLVSLSIHTTQTHLEGIVGIILSNCIMVWCGSSTVLTVKAGETDGAFPHIQEIQNVTLASLMQQSSGKQTQTS